MVRGSERVSEGGMVSKSKSYDISPARADRGRARAHRAARYATPLCKGDRARGPRPPAVRIHGLAKVVAVAR